MTVLEILGNITIDFKSRASKTRGFEEVQEVYFETQEDPVQNH